MWDKVKEETAEVEAEMRSGDKANLEAEFGDLFFALVNAARLYGVDPESALERTNKKFIRRFNYMEEQAAAQGNSLHDLSLGQMEALWQEAKKRRIKRLPSGSAFMSGAPPYGGGSCREIYM